MLYVYYVPYVCMYMYWLYVCTIKTKVYELPANPYTPLHPFTDETTRAMRFSSSIVLFANKKFSKGILVKRVKHAYTHTKNLCKHL